MSSRAGWPRYAPQRLGGEPGALIRRRARTAPGHMAHDEHRAGSNDDYLGLSDRRSLRLRRLRPETVLRFSVRHTYPQLAHVFSTTVSSPEMMRSRRTTPTASQRTHRLAGGGRDDTSFSYANGMRECLSVHAYYDMSCLRAKGFEPRGRGQPRQTHPVEGGRT